MVGEWSGDKVGQLLMMEKGFQRKRRVLVHSGSRQ